MTSFSLAQAFEWQRRRAGKTADSAASSPQVAKPKPHSCACGGSCPRCQSGRKAGDGEGDVGALADAGAAEALDGGGGAPAAPPTKTIAIDALTLRGASRNPAADVTFANTVFRPANVQFSLVNSAAASNADSDTWLGGDTDLAVGKCGAASGEELATWNGAVATHKFSSRLRAFFVTSISSGNRGDSYSPGCGNKGTSAPLVGMISVTNIGASRTLAHELGHILLDQVGHSAAPDNLMHPTDGSTGEKLTAAQIATIYANA